MTIPYSDELIPCPHSKKGWCLSCVKELMDKGSTIEIGRPFNFSVGDGQLLPAGVVVSFGVLESSRGSRELNNDYSGVRHLEPLPEVNTKYEIVCDDFGAPPVSSPPSPQEITVFSYEDNSPSLFDPLALVLSVLVSLILFALLWVIQ